MRFGLRGPRPLLGVEPRPRRSSFARPLLEPLEDRCLLSADFLQTNLVSDVPGLAQVTDANSVNAWGLIAGPNGPFWAANQGTGTSTLYNTANPRVAVQSLVVKIPAPPRTTLRRRTVRRPATFSTPVGPASTFRKR
jgi:hypothetical protein